MSSKHRTYVIGLTGGIGSGKTLVSDHFKSLGVPVIDTDIIARQIVEPGMPTLDKLCETFGRDILDQSGALDRKALRTIGFSTQQNKQKLDAITHPAIRLETIRQLAEIDADYCIVVVPLLTMESPFVELMERIIVVTAGNDTKVQRVMTRSQLSKDEVVKIMASQISDEDRIQLADDVINNNASIEQTLKAVDQLHQKYLDLISAQH